MDESTKRGLLAAYGRLLRPLIRILIRNGVVFDEFAAVAKETYVRVASENSEQAERVHDEEQIEKLTGLDLNQIRETLNEIDRRKVDPYGLGVKISVVLTVWYTNSDFTGPYGLPLELPFDEAKDNSFSQLVLSCFPDADITEILKEMIRTGTIIETQPNWYKVQTRSYIAESGPDLIEHLSETIEVVANTIDYNDSQKSLKEKLFQRQVQSDEGMREEDLPKFAAFAGHKAQLLLEEIDNWISQQDKPEKNDSTKLNTGFGIYHYVVRDPDNKSQ